MRNYTLLPSLAVVTLLAGCTDAPPPADIREQSGTRLKIEWWELAGGGLQVRGVYDAQLAAECRFVRQTDGAFTCGDVAATFEVQPAPMRVVATSLRADDGLVLPLGFYDRERDVECVPMATVSGEWRCAPYDADVTAEDPLLVSAIDAGGDRLAPRFMTSDEGLHQHLPSFYDRELATTCSVAAPAADQSAYCLPPTAPALPLDAYVPALPSIDP
jgi:hypothetical protein